MKMNGILLEGVGSIENTFATYFHSNMNGGGIVTKREDLQAIYAQHFSNDYDYLWERYIHEVSIDQVREMASQLDINKGPGPSLLIADLVKSTFEVSVPLVHKIVQTIFESNVVPAVLKTSLLVPIPKKGAKDEVLNYR